MCVCVKINVQSVREQQEHVFLAQLQTDTGTYSKPRRSRRAPDMAIKRESARALEL
jgi:hypothetical protein